MSTHIEDFPEDIENEDINTDNDFFLGYSRLDNVLGSAIPIQITSKQQAYRTAAWIIAMAEILPDEPVASTFDEVLEAVKQA